MYTSIVQGPKRFKALTLKPQTRLRTGPKEQLNVTGFWSTEYLTTCFSDLPLEGTITLRTT